MTRDSAYFSSNALYLEALEAQASSPDKLMLARPAQGKTGFTESTSRPLHVDGRKFAALGDSDLPLLKCEARQVGVLQLINAYRYHGFRVATLDPLALQPTPNLPELDPATHGLTPADLDETFETGSLAGPPRDTLRNILNRVRTAYCGTLGAEYMHLRDTRQKRWLQQRLELSTDLESPDIARKTWLLAQLTNAETLEKVIHTRYVGQKRFSLEGGESLIPLLNYVSELAAAAGIKEIGLGMAHRGRLNVLHNVLGRNALAFFETESATAPEGALTGDVKYHQGFAMEVPTQAGPIRIAMAFNPSHLEIIGPPVLGWVRAQQQKRGDHDGSLVMPVLIHGDAAISGQGVVMEALNMSATRGFSTGGTLHVVINNQIGFTTSDPRDSRSTLYCTDVMKMIDAPVLHVNGDDPEVVLRAVQIAFDYRTTFKHDIAIDLVCYRRLGHNEQDEPMVTQPHMYHRIRELDSVRALYARQLVNSGLIGADQPEALIERCHVALDKAPVEPERPYGAYVADWRPYRGSNWRAPAETSLELSRVQALGGRLTHLPEGFAAHSRVIQVMENRRQMTAGKQPLDWGMAEALAFASLLTQGYGVRLTGQDSGRGTFFHRHAILHDQDRRRWEDGVYIPLQHLTPEQAHFLVIDSLLSEEAALGFEYGYASSAPEELVLWEAQFGDFANGAQVVIDQFIAAGEAKWGRLNGLVMLLPHGYEGQGPEHSSARIERFLQLAAQENMQLAQPSTPAQFFHLLRRQLMRPYRKPLVIFTPKSLLRHPLASSALDDLTQGTFQPVLDDLKSAQSAQASSSPNQHIRRLVLCSGRLYYELLQQRNERLLQDLALVRIEQFYPFPDLEVQALLGRYPSLEEIVWAQDEPQNQGAWRYMAWQIRQLSDLPLRYAGRPESASPATGYASLHKAQAAEIVATALGMAS